MAVELVSVGTSDGLTLHGCLQSTSELSSSRLGIDAVIMHHHMTGTFYSSPVIAGLADMFAAEGCAVLRVNSRGAGQVMGGPSPRLGSAYEVIDDCRLDWRAWVDFAEKLGYERIALLGHSIGAVKTSYYLATEHDPRVRQAILVSPPLFSSLTDLERYFPADTFAEFTQHLEKTQRLIEAGAGETLLDGPTPLLPPLATARTFVDKYGPDQHYRILDTLPRVRAPIFISYGSEEGLPGPGGLQLFLDGLADKVRTIAQAQSNAHFELVEGANHFYAGKLNELWSVTRRWLENTKGPQDSS